MDSAPSDRPLIAPQMPLDRAVERARAEFHEMPGLSLTRDQARRLFGLETSLCDAALAELTAARVLRQTSGGAFIRDRD